MASLAVTAAIIVGTAAVQSLTAPKSKLQPIDRGRLDDLRIATAEEDAFVPLCFGERVRLAPNAVWATPTKESVAHSPGRSGGKGGTPRAAEPPTNNFSYTKSFAHLICDTPVKHILRVWEDDEVIYNGIGSDVHEAWYEAETARVAGVASVVAGALYSGGRAVSLTRPLAGVPGFVEWADLYAFTAGGHKLTIFYKETTDATLTLLVNGASQSVVLGATAGAVASVEVTVTLARGNNVVRLTQATLSASTVVDRVHVRETALAGPAPDPAIVPTTGVDPTGTLDPLDPPKYYNVAAVANTDGEAEGTVTGGGQAPFEWFYGTETQGQSTAIVAAEGADKTPAFRGSVVAVWNQYQVRANRGTLGNFTYEIEPEIQDLAEILEYLYKLAGATDDELDFSAVSGTVSKGFVVDQLQELGVYVQALEIWHNFDVVPSNGKIVAVPRGGPVVATIPEADLAAHAEGSARPLGPLKATHPDPLDLPEIVNISSINPAPGKDYHTSTVPARRSVAGNFDAESMAFPIVSDEDEARAVGLRWLHERHVAAHTRDVVTFQKWRHLRPTDPVILDAEGSQVRCRIVSRQAELQGLVKLKLVPEQTAVYTQTAAGSRRDGREGGVGFVPASSIGVLIDGPLARPEDAGDGTSPVLIAAASRFSYEGSHRGVTLYKEQAADEYDRQTHFEVACGVGHVGGALPAAAHTVPDRVNTLRVNFFGDEELSSVDEAELAARPQQNLLWVGRDGVGEFIQFAQAVPAAAAPPYRSAFDLSTLLRGRFASDPWASLHTADDVAVVMDSRVKPLRLSVGEIGRAQRWKFVSVGEAAADVAPQTQTLQANSLKAPPVAQLTGARYATRNLPASIFDGSILAEWRRVSRLASQLRDGAGAPLGEEEEVYEVEVLSGGAPVHTVRGVRPGRLSVPVLWAREVGSTLFTTYDAEGSVSLAQFGGSTRFESYAESEQAFTGDFAVEFVVSLAMCYVGVALEGSDPADPASLRFFLKPTASAFELQPEGDATAARTFAAGSRVAVVGRAGVVSYYENWTGSATDRPFYVSERTQEDLRYRVRAGAFLSGSTGSALNVRLLRSTPEFYLTNAMQKHIFGAPPASVTLRVYPVSAVAGRGAGREVTI